MRQHDQPSQLIEVDPQRIQFSQFNPRKHEGLEYLRLQQSVQELGMVQYPTVRVRPGGLYECVDGEGRVRSAQDAGFTTIKVISLGVISDAEALHMLQAANTVRSFSYLAACKGLANLHRQGQSGESIARSVGASASNIQHDVGVGYFPDQIINMIQENIRQSDPVDHGGKHTFSWEWYAFEHLLHLRTQIKERLPGDPSSLDGLYDYTEVRRAVEKIIAGDIVTVEQLQVYVEQRRRELFEQRFDKLLQEQIEKELELSKQMLQESHQQQLEAVREETGHLYASQVQVLQQQLEDLEKQYQKIVKQVAKHPELVAKREAELEQKRQEVEDERIRLCDLQRQLQEEAQERRQQIEQDLKNEAEATLQEHRTAIERELKQAHDDLEKYYAEKDQQRQIKAEKTFRQAIAHGIELLSQTHQWLLLLITPGMRTGLSWLSEPEMVSLLGQIETVRATLEKAEEVIMHGSVSDTVAAEEGGFNGYDDSSREKSKNLGYG